MAVSKAAAAEALEVYLEAEKRKAKVKEDDARAKAALQHREEVLAELNRLRRDGVPPAKAAAPAKAARPSHSASDLIRPMTASEMKQAKAMADAVALENRKTKIRSLWSQAMARGPDNS